MAKGLLEEVLEDLLHQSNIGHTFLRVEFLKKCKIFREREIGV